MHVVELGAQPLVLGEELLLVLLEHHVLLVQLDAQLLRLGARALELRLLLLHRALLLLIAHREPLAEPQHDALQHLREAVQHARQLGLGRDVAEDEELLLEHCDALLHPALRRIVERLAPRLDRLETRRHLFELGLDRVRHRGAKLAELLEDG